VKRAYLVGVILFLFVGTFFAGSWYGHSRPDRASIPARKILYYIDPMHPSYKSDKPGIAPDCGMELVPVFEDGGMGGQSGSLGGTAPGTVQISAERQQVIGVRIALADKAGRTHGLRILGRVSPDESLTYRINAATEIWIRKVFPPTTGSLVRKDEPLAAYYTGAFLSAANAYLFALDTQDRHRQSADISKAQAQNLDFQMRQAVGNLINMGVSESQIQEMGRTRKVSELVEIRSPSDGFILNRAASPGQFVPVGNEVYRIADLRKVWILAEIYENEGRFVKPGMKVRGTHPQTTQTFDAEVSEILPQFDPQSRTMKVRLEAGNPGLHLRPDMFVDLEVPVARPAAIVVPVDAVVDSGVRKVVYVAKGDGVFEPRRVETGWRAGDQVEIVKGLMPGEKIVVSGTFLIDSESRMKAAAAGIYGETSEDPVCGMDVDQSRAKAAARMSNFRSQSYYFCSDECKAAFDKEPTRYAAKVSKGAATEAGTRLEHVQRADSQEKEHTDAGHHGRAHPPAQRNEGSGHQHP
jgi:RND family efflux transporter MFP subunit